MRAEEARRAAQRASSDLYAAMAELKQTEIPLLNAQQETKRAAAVAESAMASLAEAQAHFDQEMSRLGSPEVANKEAAAAKKDVGESMAEITAASSQAKAHLETCREAWESADDVFKATAVKAAASLDAAAQVGSSWVDWGVILRAAPKIVPRSRCFFFCFFPALAAVEGDAKYRISTVLSIRVPYLYIHTLSPATTIRRKTKQHMFFERRTISCGCGEDGRRRRKLDHGGDNVRRRGGGDVRGPGRAGSRSRGSRRESGERHGGAGGDDPAGARLCTRQT